MIPALSLMIGFYIVVKMLETMLAIDNRKQKSNFGWIVYGAAFVAIGVAILAVTIIFFQADEAAKSLNEAKQSLDSLGQ